MKNIFFLSFLLFFTTGCVDDYDYTPKDEVIQLVIWGEINDEPGPYKIKLSKSKSIFSNVSNDPNSIKDINGAEVKIIDGDGNEFELKQSGKDGVYLTADDSFRGKVGKAYKLWVKTADGKTYSSTYEKIMPPVPISSLSSKFLMKDSLNKYGLKEKQKGHLIFGSTKDPGGERNYYRWRWNGTFKMKILHPVLLCDKIKCIYCPFVPCAREAFRDEIPGNGYLSIRSDLLIDGSEFTVPVGFIEEVFPRFSGSPYYYFNLVQQSLTPEYFNYLNKVKSQLQVGGTVDPPPTSITGNLSATNNSGEEVLGYFSAISTSSKSFFFKSHYRILPDSFKCLLYVENKYCEKPDYWTVD